MPPAHPEAKRASLLRTIWGMFWQLLTTTVSACYRSRVIGLAAEAAFFAVLSVPPLVFGLASSISRVVARVDPGAIALIEERVIEFSAKGLTDQSVEQIVEPTVSTVLDSPRFDVISLGFVLALWSGSRALNVFVDTITIMYGLEGQRGIVKTRLLAFGLYVAGLVIGVVVLPLVLAGPELINEALPDRFDALNQLYWPLVLALTVAFLMSLYHLSVPVRTSWRRNFLGSAFALFMLIGGSALLRDVLTSARTSIFGPLSAPIAVLLWLYLMALAVLIGAAINASYDEIWPEQATAKARLELVRRWRERTGARWSMLPTRRAQDEEKLALRTRWRMRREDFDGDRDGDADEASNPGRAERDDEPTVDLKVPPARG